MGLPHGDAASKVVNELTDPAEKEDEAMAGPPIPVEGFIEGFQLLPHQEKARRWMKQRESGGNAGGILADDMGLGKTIQAITRVSEGKPTKQDLIAGWSKTTLIVAKVTILGQWESEIVKIAPSLTVLQQHGSSRTNDPERLRGADVVLTTYETLRSEHSTFTRKKVPQKILKALYEVKWWRTVLDEAHEIRNADSQAAIACFALDAKSRWCLTGTPMQNSVKDFYSLFHFLRLDQMDDITTFNAKVVKPITSGNEASGMKALHKILEPVMLRRTKAAINDNQSLESAHPSLLPLRRVFVRNLDMDPDELRIYYEFSHRHLVGYKIRNLQKEKKPGNGNYLTMMLRKRQMCDHPTLIFNNVVGKDDRCQLCQKQLSSSDMDLYCSRCLDVVDNVADAFTEASGAPKKSTKIREILKILGETATRDQQEKTVIFSQWTSMLDLIEPFLFEAGIGFIRIDGKMSAVERTDSAKKFAIDKNTKVLLASLKTAGVGLNLTAANNVILVEPWWNPAVEKQACDRVHRFGQHRDVNIIKLIMSNTIEDIILARQKQKSDLTDAALKGSDIKLTKEELFEIFTAHLRFPTK